MKGLSSKNAETAFKLHPHSQQTAGQYRGIFYCPKRDGFYFTIDWHEDGETMLCPGCGTEVTLEWPFTEIVH